MFPTKTSNDTIDLMMSSNLLPRGITRLIGKIYSKPCKTHSMYGMTHLNH